MKATISPEAKKFVPFNITITLESQLEVDQLSAASRHSDVFPEASAKSIWEALDGRDSDNAFDALYHRIKKNVT